MKRLISILALTGLGILSACSGDQSPRLIAALPVGGEGQSTAAHPESMVYDAYLEIEVYDPITSATKAGEMAESFGGYLISSQTARWEREIQVTVVLAVTARNFEKLRTALLRLGKLKHERLYGDWQDGRWYEYSEVTVAFLPSALQLPNLPSSWNPGRTFRQASGVFLTIIGFLTDILIWIVVVAGPFALLFWAGWRLWKSKRPRAH